MAKPDLAQLWKEHTAHEFSTRDAEATLGQLGGRRLCQPVVPAMARWVRERGVVPFLLAGLYLPPTMPPTLMAPSSNKLYKLAA